MDICIEWHLAIDVGITELIVYTIDSGDIDISTRVLNGNPCSTQAGLKQTNCSLAKTEMMIAPAKHHFEAASPCSLIRSGQMLTPGAPCTLL